MNNASLRILLIQDNLSEAKLLQQTLWHLGKQKWQVVHFEQLSDAINACSKSIFDIVLLDLSLPDSEGLNPVEKFYTEVPNIPIVILTELDDEDFALQGVANSVQDYLLKGQITPNLLRRAIRYGIERGQILKQLRESEHRLHFMFEQTFQSMALLTPEGIILEINQTALNLWGRQQQNCIGKPLWELESWNFSSENQEWLKSIIAKTADGEFVRHELHLHSTNDVMVWIDFSLKPLKDETGKVVRLIVQGWDISEQKRAEAEIMKAWEQERELNEMKSNFVSMVSHEFRNPMSVIRTAVELLELYNHQLSDQQRSKYFRNIQTAIRQMQQLLDEVLFWSRSDAGKLQYEPILLNLENFCSELTQTLQLSATQKHQIIFSFQGKDTPVLLDENLLRYILTNLLSNAIKYSPQGGVIIFDVNSQDDNVTFQIQDSGIGIPLKDQHILFETFHRASNVGNIPGTGLGLSIVKRCVDLHQGQIYLESQVGIGTTFTVKIPLSDHSVQSLELIESSSDLQTQSLLRDRTLRAIR
ncbi:ATP-binding protein [Brasilonema sp. UFV-L1]|uniref:sensor histidine kinase n=1 Tax=Brasilonema sp. UFV-L1 TaxID=2234130 RepID=UPI00145C45D8|nr:ATP-binding protein [Brasilonema sp. UFV-L1]NMG09420.1 hybrid sensor histidine kinase/response regulator [Brasilonema sp. UFV-L1]